MTVLIGAVRAPELHVISFNVRRRMAESLSLRTADRWRTRRPRVQEFVRRERPTVLGTQEAMPDQAAAIGEALGGGYRYVGYGREAGRRGEGCPLFFDAERLELLAWAQTALSTRPHVAGSIAWGAMVPRVMVRATFRDRETSTQFTVINTHLDPFSRPARVRAARMVATEAAGTELPTIVTGDFNARAVSSTWRALTAGGELTDAWLTARRHLTPEWGTFADYRRPRIGRGRIDGILTTASVTVERIGINANQIEGGWPSDHLALQAVVRLGAEGA